MNDTSSTHYHQLKQALLTEQREPRLGMLPEPVRYRFPYMNISVNKRTLFAGLFATPLVGAALAGIIFFQKATNHQTNPLTLANVTQVAQNLSLNDFISAAQAAAADNAVRHVDQVLHQKYTQMFLVGGQPVHDIYESWRGNKNYADVVTSPTGNIQEKFVSVTDAQGKQRGYDLHPTDPITNPVDEAVMADTGICGFNLNDIPELSFEVQLSQLNGALSNPDQTQRISILQTMIDDGKVTDLGEQNGVRGLEVSAHGQRYQYWFDTNTFRMKSYKEFDAHNNVQRDEEYQVDEYLTESENSLPIFTDLTGLTEIHMYPSSLPDNFFETHPSGCYNADGTPSTTSQETKPVVTVDDNGSVTTTSTITSTAGDTEKK